MKVASDLINKFLYLHGGGCICNRGRTSTAFLPPYAIWPQVRVLMKQKPDQIFGRTIGMLVVTLLVMAFPSLSYATDSDTDGVPDTIDQCPNTVPDTGKVPRLELKVGHFVLTTLGSGATFDTREPAQTSFSIDDTAGCSCAQLIDKLQLGKKARRYGCSIGTLEEWNRSVYSTPLMATGQNAPLQAMKNDGNDEFVDVADDGTLQLGLPLRYRDNGPHTVTHLTSGLMWEKKCDCPGDDHDILLSLPWSGDGTQDTIWDWVDRLNAANFGGYSDWRVPNFREMMSMLDDGWHDTDFSDPTRCTLANGRIDGQFDPAVNPVFHNCVDSFTSVNASGYWTSTTNRDIASQGYTVSFRFGYTNSRSKTSLFPVRAVRGEGRLLATGQKTSYQADKNDGIAGPVDVQDDGTLQRGTPLKYVDNGDGTITDWNTGLMWEKKCDTCDPTNLHHGYQKFVWSRKEITDSTDTIWDFIDDVNAEAYAGHDDWRNPNYRELLSIMDYEQLSAAINPVFAPNMGRQWTSTHEGLKSNLPQTNIYWLEFENVAGRHTSGCAFTTQPSNVTICDWPIRAVRGGRLAKQFDGGTVVIDECNTGVPNYTTEDGTSISELIDECAIGAKHHLKYVICVAKLTGSLKRDDVLLRTQKRAINSCAWKADIP